MSSDITERAERLAEVLAKADTDLLTTDAHERAEWRAVDAISVHLEGREHRSYVTCVPTDHDCWDPKSMIAYPNLGIWDQWGLTTRGYAEAIASLRNAAPEVADVLRVLVHGLRNARAAIEAQRHLIEAADRELDEMRPVVEAAVDWRATPPVDAPVSQGGSTAPWVRAYRDLEQAVDAYRAKRGIR